MLARDKAEQIKRSLPGLDFLRSRSAEKNMWIFTMKPLTATDNEAMMALI